MPVFDKKDFPKVLKQIEEGNIAPIYLLHGEDYMAKSALEELTGLVVPESQRGTSGCPFFYPSAGVSDSIRAVRQMLHLRGALVRALIRDPG